MTEPADPADQDLDQRLAGQFAASDALLADALPIEAGLASILRRGEEQRAEHDDPVADNVSLALDGWTRVTQNVSGDYKARPFLDLLAALGYEVTPIHQKPPPNLATDIADQVIKRLGGRASIAATWRSVVYATPPWIRAFDLLAPILGVAAGGSLAIMQAGHAVGMLAGAGLVLANVLAWAWRGSFKD